MRVLWYDALEQQSDAATIEKSKKMLGQMESVLGADSTIQSLCEDIVNHYEKYRANLLTGKAMIVAYSRPIAMKIYRKLLELRPTWNEKIGVVMTGGNNDPEDWKEIIGTKSHKEELARKFKDNDDPMKIAIVVDMWLTGFDVPSLATMYVYKPMHGYNLMQAIARVNRVFKDKEGGLIVDYVGIASALKAAMKEYTKRDQSRYGDMDIAKVAYKRTNVVQSQKFSEKITQLMNSYYNGLITNEEVIKELLKTAQEITELYNNGKKLGLTQEELAFYDALTKPENIKDFYQNNELIDLTRELTEMLRKNRTIDWQKKETARASMRKMVKHLLKKYKYPPEDYDTAISTVISQCEMWTDNMTI